MTQKRNHVPSKNIFRALMILLEKISLLDEHILYHVEGDSYSYLIFRISIFYQIKYTRRSLVIGTCLQLLFPFLGYNRCVLTKTIRLKKLLHLTAPGYSVLCLLFSLLSYNFWVGCTCTKIWECVFAILR